MKKRLMMLCFLVTMIFQPLSAKSVDGTLYLTFNLNGHLYTDVYIEDANEMLCNTVADGIETVLTNEVCKAQEIQLMQKKAGRK